uniref:Uncharacterized protein n=1 Tax=Clastoptera arizonana TaxID=38151 RepID=A0A1B6D2G4_9HEMI
MLKICLLLFAVVAAKNNRDATIKKLKKTVSEMVGNTTQVLDSMLKMLKQPQANSITYLLVRDKLIVEMKLLQDILKKKEELLYSKEFINYDALKMLLPDLTMVTEMNLKQAQADDTALLRLRKKANDVLDLVGSPSSSLLSKKTN